MIPFNQPAVRRYLNDIGRHPLMTPAEEIECGKLVQEALALQQLDRALTTRERNVVKRAERARKRFVEANLRMVVTIAKRYAGQNLQSIELLDLVQEGSMGLMRAVEMFDPTRGYKFSTYAYWWIRQAMTRAIGQKDPMIRMPHAIVDKVVNMKRVVREESQKLGRAPTKDEIAAILDISLAQLDELVARSLPAVSLNLTCGSDDENTLLDIIADPASAGEWEEALQLELALRQDILRNSLMRLSDRDRELLCMRYGLMGYEPTTYGKMGEAQGVSRERIRQLITQAHNRLKVEMDRELVASARIGTVAKPAALAKESFRTVPAPLPGLPPLLPETLPMQNRQQVWNAPVPRRGSQPSAKLTAA